MSEEGIRPVVFVVFLVFWLCASVLDAAAADPGPVAGGAAEGGRRQVVLRDGSTFIVDELREEGGRCIYRLGNMQGFLERGEIAALQTVREAEPGGEAPREEAVVSPFSTGNRGLDQLIVDTAARYQLDPLLIYLVMREESGFNYRAVSRVGARGLMQLMPATARRLGVRNIHNPIENVEAGARYLRWLIEVFDGDVNLALAAYNAGEGTVHRYGRRIPPYPETRRYVWRINTAYRRLKGE